MSYIKNRAYQFAKRYFSRVPNQVEIIKEKKSDKIEEYYSIRNSLEIGMDQENSIQLLGLLADMIND